MKFEEKIRGKEEDNLMKKCRAEKESMEKKSIKMNEMKFLFTPGKKLFINIIYIIINICNYIQCLYMFSFSQFLT